MVPCYIILCCVIVYYVYYIILQFSSLYHTISFYSVLYWSFIFNTLYLASRIIRRAKKKMGKRILQRNYRNIQMNYLLQALVKKLEGEIEVAKANVMVYKRNSVGIGEHPDIVEAIETQIAKISEAEDKIEAIKKHFST